MHVLIVSIGCVSVAAKKEPASAPAQNSHHVPSRNRVNNFDIARRQRERAGQRGYRGRGEVSVITFPDVTPT